VARGRRLDATPKTHRDRTSRRSWRGL